VLTLEGRPLNVEWYDDEALYISAICYDKAPDSIYHRITKRDALENSDHFAIIIDTYRDGQNAVLFGVSPDNVQFDSKFSIAGGDSGGGAFIDGKLASINSYGLTFGGGFGDFGGGLNSGWGEYSGYVPIFIHEDFILASLVPAPGTWATLMLGLGLTGVALQRRRKAAATA